mgnify:CR=1 FL=1
MIPQYKIISTGSKGNAILYHGCILVDCGVPFTLLKPYYKDIKLVLLTHIHGDHFNLTTIKKLAFERPTIKFGCGSHLTQFLPPHINIDIYTPNRTYVYNFAAITPVELNHDVPNFGYKIYSYNTKLFHATDTSTLEGIEAKDYDLYAIEHNYDEESTIKKLYEDDEKGKFNYQSRSVLTHMSEQQAKEWLYKNKNENSEVLRLHESSTFL